jgi:uncharacterized DUF497 family protein
MTKITSLVWDNYNKEHIKKHNVTVREVEKAVQSAKTHKKVKNGRFLLIGRTGTRILSIILVQETKKTYFVVTARDAARKERILFYEKENK